MPVEAQTVEYSYLGDGVSTVFGFPSRFLSNSDLFVALNGVVQVAGFTITGAGSNSGGTVTFAVAPPNLTRVLFVRNPSPSQLLDFENGQTVLEGTLDNGLDKLTMIAQYLLRSVKRSVRIPDASYAPEPSTSLELPVASARGLKFIAFDATGKIELLDRAALEQANADAVAAIAAAAAAVAAAAETATTYDEFDDRYLGDKLSLPGLDNDGDALQTGALAFLRDQADPLDDGLYRWNGAAWGGLTVNPIALERIENVFVSPAQAAGGVVAVPGGYIAGTGFEVRRNGVVQKQGPNLGAGDGEQDDDCTASSGTNVVYLAGRLSAGDWMQFAIRKPYSVAAVAAVDVSFAPAGGVAATNLQTALQELDAEKASLVSPTFTGSPAAPTPAPGGNDTSIATTEFVNAAIAAALAATGAAIPGEVKDWPGPALPAFYAWADGAAVSRATFSLALANLTRTFTGTAANGSATITGVSPDPRNLGLEGAVVEGTIGATSGLTIASVTASTIVLSGNATANGAISLQVFPHGRGNGTTTYNLPDRRGRVGIGRDNMGGTTASRVTATGTGNPGIDATRLGVSGGVDRHQLTTAELAAHTHTYLRDGTIGTQVGATSLFAGSEVSTASGSTGGDTAHRNVQPSSVTNFIVYLGQ